MAIETDPVAAAITARLQDGGTDNVVTLCGYVSYEPGEETVRLSTEWFDRFLMIPADKVLYQLKGSDRPQAGERSCIWVVADAPVTSCVVREARFFTDSGSAGDARLLADPLPDSVEGGYGGGGGGKPP